MDILNTVLNVLEVIIAFIGFYFIVREFPLSSQIFRISNPLLKSFNLSQPSTLPSNMPDGVNTLISIDEQINICKCQSRVIWCFRKKSITTPRVGSTHAMPWRLHKGFS